MRNTYRNLNARFTPAVIPWARLVERRIMSFGSLLMYPTMAPPLPVTMLHKIDIAGKAVAGANVYFPLIKEKVLKYYSFCRTLDIVQMRR